MVLDEPGNYSVTVTQNHEGSVCSSTLDFEVFLSNPATVTQVTVADWTPEENVLTVVLGAASLGDYVYSPDGTNYQESPVFEGLPPGVYTVYVKDLNGCGEVTTIAYILNYPKFFTTNGDGIHDTWQVRFAEYEPGLSVRLFDRFGKLLRTMGYDEGWDGTYNGKPLPSDDYWFVVQRADGRVFRGHFAIKR